MTSVKTEEVLDGAMVFWMWLQYLEVVELEEQ